MKQEIRAALLDFDGTLVTRDILDVLCKEMGKEEASSRLNQAFQRGEIPGLTTLVKRINFLTGLPLTRMPKILTPNSYLMPGARNLIKFFNRHHIITIMASGNILPVLEYYQSLLGITHVVGSQPNIKQGVIEGIKASAFSDRSFKVNGILRILKTHHISQSQCIAVGDAPSDKGMFSLSSYSVAINPKGDIARYADAVVYDDLTKVTKILKQKFFPED